MQDRESATALAALLQEVRACQLCEAHLPFPPRPVLVADVRSRILIIGQAPGTRVHATGIPWNDPSGDQLRSWMGLSRDCFYSAEHISIVPMGFCYPGRGRSGDLPPRPECAPQWHERIFAGLPRVELVLLVGQYAQQYYLGGRQLLTERVRAFGSFGPRYFPLPHPSPRNRLWLKRNAWFGEEVLPVLRQRVHELIDRGRQQ